jgi:hypothetical protein
MTRHNPAETMSEDRRRDIFRALVEAQDRGLTVQQSREHVAQHYRVSVRDVVAIEQEGGDNGWPPL